MSIAENIPAPQLPDKDTQEPKLVEANPDQSLEITAINEALSEPVDIDSREPTVSGSSSRLHAAKTSIELAIVAAELSPLNEIMRFTPYAATVAGNSHPLISGAVLGGATLAVEGAAALATADLLDSEKGKKIVGWVNDKTGKLFAGDIKMSPVAEAGVAYLGGSAVVLAEKQREDPTRTAEQNRKHGIWTASWLAGTLAVQGALLAEGIQSPDPQSIGIALVAAAGVPAIAKWAKNLASRNQRPAEVMKDKHKNHVYALVEDPVLLEKAAILEQEVWTERNYGDLSEEGYDEHIANSRTFACFDGEECVGMTRMFAGNEQLQPPFLDMPFYDEKDKSVIAAKTSEGEIEELGTAAVVPELRGAGINTRLWRMAYRDARARGIESWGIVMEPERVQRMNDRYGFTFRQLGEPIAYQGGDCAAHIMDLDAVDKSMSKKHPLSHYWFVKKPFKS